MTTTPDLLTQLRQFLAIEQAARAVAPSAGGLFAAGQFVGDMGMPSAPNAGPMQADAMVLDLLTGADDDELLAARRDAGPADSSQEAMWLADEIDRRGIAAK